MGTIKKIKLIVTDFIRCQDNMVLCVLRHLQKRNRICAVGLNTCLKRFYSVSTPQVINVDDDVRIPKMPSGMVSSNPMDHEDYFNVAELVKIKELFDARVHLGHHEGCWDENTRPYIYGARGKQHVINLNETVKCLKIALNVLSHVVYQNGVVCFIATNPRHDYLIQKTARECGEYYITRAWQMGMFNHIQNRLKTNRHPDLIIAFNLSRFERSRDA